MRVCVCASNIDKLMFDRTLNPNTRAIKIKCFRVALDGICKDSFESVLSSTLVQGFVAFRVWGRISGLC